MESKHEAAQAYVDAAHCYKKTSSNGKFLAPHPGYIHAS